MEINSKDDLYKWIDFYIKSFYSENKTIQENIILKEKHTYRVIENIINIGKSLELDENKMEIVEVIALLHDVGRFYQFSKYNTFNDEKSIDHGEIAVEIIKDNNLLDYFSKENIGIILDSIKYHNKLELPKKIFQDGNILFLKIIKDADKLDVFKVIMENKFGIMKISNSRYSKKVFDDILKRKNINRKDMLTINDKKLFFLSWIYDIYFDYTFKKILEEKFIDKLLKLLPNNLHSEIIKNEINSYIREIKSGSVY